MARAKSIVNQARAMLDADYEAYYHAVTVPKLPTYPLGVWRYLVSQGFFTTSRGKKAEETKHWEPTREQWQWFRWVLEQRGHFMFLGARKVGKTELLTIYQCVWQIYRNPQYKIIIVTGTGNRGKYLVRNIYDMLVALGVPLKTDAQTEITTAHNKSKSPNVKYHGVEARMKGDHVDLIIIDDPLDEKEGHSEEKRRAVSSMVLECKSMADRVMMIGQYTHEEDIFMEYQGKIPTMTAWRHEYPHLVMMTEEEYCAGKGGNTRRSWLMNYEGIIIPDIEAVFADIQLTTVYPWSQAHQTSKVVAYIDPSLDGDDRTAMAIGATYHDPTLNHKVLVAWLFSWADHYVDCVSQIAQVISILGASQVYYEDNGGSHRVLRDKLTELGIPKATPFATTQNKVVKIQSIVGLVRSGYVQIHTDTDADDLKRLRNWTPASKHDDVPDSLAMLARHMFAIQSNPKILKR